MRRLVTCTAAAGLGLFAMASAAWAGESITSGSWTGSALDAGPTTITEDHARLSGVFRRTLTAGNRQIEVTISTVPAGSDACTVAPVKLPWASTPRAFDATLTIPCNGNYTLTATAETTDDGAFRPHERAVLDRTVTVSAPAPTVTGLVVDGAGRSIDLSWDDMRAAAPDLSGYVLERKLDDGDFEALEPLGPDVTAYTDDDLPTAGGDATYRIFSTRPVVDGSVTSASSGEATASFPAASKGSTGTTTPGGSSGDGGSGDGSGGGGSTDGGAQGSGGGGSSSSRTRARAPRVFSGTFLPPLLRPVDMPTTPTTIDTGFDESLPYADPEEDPTSPEDAMSSIFSEGQPGRGMAIPVATALVLAVWAMHLRLIARAARPVD